MTFSQACKAANAAPKYLLAAWHPERHDYVFIADQEKTGNNCIITADYTKAELYSIGWDDKERKEKVWTANCKMSGLDIEFIAINLADLEIN